MARQGMQSIYGPSSLPRDGVTFISKMACHSKGTLAATEESPLLCSGILRFAHIVPMSFGRMTILRQVLPLLFFQLGTPEQSRASEIHAVKGSPANTR